MSYSEKLKDPRWQKKRLGVFQAANWMCEDCGNTKASLEVHHTAYILSKEPWEYDSDLLMCVCSDCHEHRQKIEDTFRVALGKITRHIDRASLEDELWRVLSEIALRQTSRYAKAFGGDND